MTRVLLAAWLAVLGGAMALLVAGAVADALDLGSAYAWVSAVIFGAIMGYGSLRGWADG
jgi:hypothetical protein